MTHITQLTRRKTMFSSRILTLVLAGLVLVVLQASTVHAQWSTGANINNTNNGTVSVGTTNPGGDKLIIAGNTVGGNITSHTQLYSSYNTQNNVILELGYGTATSADTPLPSFVLSKNLTGANNALGAIQFANRNIADGSEKRLAQIATWTNGATNSGALLFSTTSAGSFAEKMRITSAGNVGIGTVSPTTTLDVAGQIRSSTGGFKFPDGTIQATAAVGGGGTITGVTAGAGLTGGGTSGSVTLNIGAGTGLSVAADSVSVNYGATAGTAVQGNASITVAAGTGMSGGGPVTLGAGGSVTLTNADPGSSQSIFKNIANAAGTTQFSAGSNSDALRFEGTGGTSVSFDAPTKRITISSGSSGWTDGGANVNLTNSSANVGIGTSTPATKLHVAGGTRVDGASGRVYLGTGAVTNYRGLEIIEENPTTFSIRHHDPGVAWQNIAINPYGGNVGIGTLSPSTKFHVVGDGTITGNLNASGTITGGNIVAKYQDVAEWVQSSQELAAGTVVVLDQTKSNQVIASSQAYDTRVAGVISSQPGITLGESGPGKLLVATTGRVRIKVDASRGSIQVGDLLVTSNIAGIAMKSQPIDVGGVQIHRPGTLIGKALEPLSTGTGEILVLLSLQ